MSRWKQRIALLTLGALLLLTGCGKSKEFSEELENPVSDQVVNLKVWGGKHEQKLLNQLVEGFTKEYANEATFSITVEEMEEGETNRELLQDVNNSADVFVFVDDQLLELTAGGVLGEIEYTDKVKKENTEKSVESASIDDTVYAYPMTADNGYFMYYNKKYFSEEDVKSLDSMLEVAKNAGKQVLMDWSSGWYLYSFFGNTGLELTLSEDSLTNICNWNSRKNAIKGTDVGNAMLEIAKHPGFLNANDEAFKEGAKKGNIIAGVSGIWLGSALQEAWGEDYGAVKLPTYTCAGKQIQMASFSGYKLVGVNDYSENREWAQKLALWLTNEKSQELLVQERGLGPSNVVAIESDEVKENLAIQALHQQSEYAKPQRVGNKYWDPVQEFGLQLANQEVTAANMQKTLDELVKKITAEVI